MANDQRSSSSSSSRKNKNKNKNNSGNNSNSNSNSNSNNNNSEKPKQPQRGLGVAQLERIRLDSQMSNNFGVFPQLHHHHHHQQFHHHLHPHAFTFTTIPFSTSLFPHVQDDHMRIQAGYHQAAVLQSSLTTPSSFGPPPPSSSSSSSSSYGYGHPNNFMMGVEEQMERTCNFRFGESHPPITTTRWNSNNDIVPMLENQHYIQSQGLVTRHLLSHVEENKIRDNMVKSEGSCNQISESCSEEEELDLELKLSL